MRYDYTEWAEDRLRSGRCGFRLVFNPIAVRFRYRHHECVLKPDHAGLHECSCSVAYDELGVLFDQDGAVRTSDNQAISWVNYIGADRGR